MTATASIALLFGPGLSDVAAVVAGFRRGPSHFLASRRVDKAAFLVTALQAIGAGDGGGAGGGVASDAARGRIVQLLQEFSGFLLPEPEDSEDGQERGHRKHVQSDGSGDPGLSASAKDPVASLAPATVPQPPPLAVLVDGLAALFARTPPAAQGLRVRLLAGATGIALQHDYDRRYGAHGLQGFAAVVELLLGCLASVADGLVRERRVACQCLAAIEEARPGLLVPKLGHLHALARAEQTHACGAHACLLASVLRSAVARLAAGQTVGGGGATTGLLATGHEALAPLGMTIPWCPPAPPAGVLPTAAQLDDLRVAVSSLMDMIPLLSAAGHLHVSTVPLLAMSGTLRACHSGLTSALPYRLAGLPPPSPTLCTVPSPRRY